MKPTKVYYRGSLVKLIINVLDPAKADISIKGSSKMLNGINKSELMIPMIEAEHQFKDLVSKIDKIKEIVE